MMEKKNISDARDRISEDGIRIRTFKKMKKRTKESVIRIRTKV